MTNVTDREFAEPGFRRAGHAGEAFDADIGACRAVLNKPNGLHYVAHVTHGILDFAMGVPGRWPRGGREADALEGAGRQLGLAVVQLGAACEPLDTGALIRVVLQGENGALFQAVKAADQTFFGLTFDGTPEMVAKADRLLASIAGSAARRIGAAVLRWGAFQHREDSGELWGPYAVSVQTGSAPQPHVMAGEGVGLPSWVTEPSRAALHPDDLHFVGIYQRDTLLWCADVFDAQALSPFFQRVSAPARRRAYGQLVNQVGLQFRRFRQLLALVRSDELVQLVLNVGHGAIYVRPLSGSEYLVAVTLSQSAVDETARKAEALHQIIAPAWQADTRLTAPPRSAPRG